MKRVLSPRGLQHTWHRVQHSWHAGREECTLCWVAVPVLPTLLDLAHLTCLTSLYLYLFFTLLYLTVQLWG
jgi:hypothetical protein